MLMWWGTLGVPTSAFAILVPDRTFVCTQLGDTWLLGVHIGSFSLEKEIECPSFFL